MVLGYVWGFNVFVNIFFVVVGGSGVDVVVFFFEGGFDGGGDFVGGGLLGVEVDGGDFCVGVESVGVVGSVG